MPAIAKVIVDIALNREFDYEIPDQLRDRVALGTRVTVPFGKSSRTGYVVGLAGGSARGDLKRISSLAGEKPLVGESILDLARWMAAYYCTPLESVVRAVLPGAVRRRGAAFKKRLLVSLCPQSDGKACAPLPPKQSAVVDRLRSSGDTLLSDLVRELGITASPVRALEKKGLLTVAQTSLRRDPNVNRRVLPTAPLELMPEQETALSAIRECMDQTTARSAMSGAAGVSMKEPSGVVLLHGVTGSGKTEVYLQAIDYALKQGRGAIVLVPEISLTPQTVERFTARFGGRIAVLHSHLSDGERHDEWHRIRDGEAEIVVGARSAVFAPVNRLGLIVVDEEHEPSYKQEDAPRYSARDVAVMRGRMERCAVVLGSATPSLESWFNASIRKYELARLPRRVDNRTMPVMRVVDMRMEAARSGHASVFSKTLLEAIRLRLDRAEQTILFLNRRGFATSLICLKCGYVANCDHCSVSYTYHRNDDRLRCHICGANRRVPEQCPECRDPTFKFSGIGTQRVESIVRKCFPQANVQRMDADMTTAKDAYDRILGDFRVGNIDILIGTQMIAKGLHFPNVTLVGVIYADLSLHMPDFRAGERTFQLLAQVAGRAGRGEVSGEVMVQTYTPFHEAVQAARRLDYEGFCDQEMEFRRELSYPPFTHLVCMTLRGPSEDKVAFTCRTLARALRERLPEKVLLADPTPAPLARAKGLYRYQLMLRCKSTQAMTEPIQAVLAAVQLPDKVTLAVDVDAISLL